MMRQVLVAMLLALPVVALATPASAAQELPPLVGVCVKGVTSADCFRQADVCVGFSYQVPQCVDAPCYPIDCIIIQKPDAHVQCTEYVYIGALAARCEVGAKEYSVATCEYCNPIFVTSCTQGTEGVSCRPIVVLTSDPIGGDCMPVYREYDFGAVRYVSRDSCHSEVYVFGEQVYPLTP